MSDATASPAALNALEAARTGRRACEHCGGHYEAVRKWARFCSDKCRADAFKAEMRRRIIHEYLAELGRKGAAARKAKRAA